MLNFEMGGPGEVRISGRLDAVQAPAAQAFLDGVGGGAVTLDCTALEYISSAGLGVLLKTHKRLLSGGGGLSLTHVGSHIRDILKYSGFDTILEVRAPG